ncbi:MAG TPA: aminotransferase class V-fold PLP-dependent enzyme [Ktedonobacterales bacterium]
MRLSSQRSLFEIPDDIAYLNCAYMSPIPRASREAGQAAVARKSRPWEIAASDFFDEAEVARSLFAELIGADADGVALVPSASYGIGVAAANLSPRADQHILVLAEQFPSNVYPWQDLAQRSGAALVTVPRPPDDDWTTALLERIDERTAVVAVPHCHWTDGGLVDLARVGERARAVGAALVVDATQSLGAYPLDLARAQPDFLAVAAYKWLLGPYSTGFLYVAPHRREGRPLEQNWIARMGSENFSGLVDYADAYQPGARRYDIGERANFALLPMVIASLRQLLEWGVANIQQTVGELTGQIERETRRLGLEPVPAERRANHLLGVRSPRPLPPDLLARLAAQRVYVSVRGQSIRVSPHVYNTEADIQRFVAAMAGAL